MAGIRIHDRSDDHVLAFDLADVLDALGDSARGSVWKCSVGECIAEEGARPDLEDAYNASAGLAGPALAELAADTIQVVDGVFEAFRPKERRPWIKLEAIDSTYWEAFAANADDLAPLSRRFAEVEIIEEDGESG